MPPTIFKSATEAISAHFENQIWIFFSIISFVWMCRKQRDRNLTVKIGSYIPTILLTKYIKHSQKHVTFTTKYTLKAIFYVSFFLDIFIRYYLYIACIALCLLHYILKFFYIKSIKHVQICFSFSAFVVHTSQRQIPS